MQDDSPTDPEELTATYSLSQAKETSARGQHSLPERLGRYVIRRKLGAGAFADVYLAHDQELDREVALKIPRPDRFSTTEALRQVTDEARTVARLQHPGIVTVFDAVDHQGISFIVLQFIRGRSLAHLLEHDTLSFAGAVQLAAEVAVALAHAHDQGFVHRDIKPRNILLDADDRPHIADFGLAARHREAGESSDEIAGTTHYMSPEQARGESHRIDGRTDIWALGVVFYQMLTGRLPFTGTSTRNVFQKILYENPVPPRQIDPSIPEELERICLRCLCRQMSERYRGARDLSEDLLEWLRFTSGGSGGSTNRRRMPVIEPPNSRVVPRGLRAFNQEDVDFFLTLIPGPRDRDGLPIGIRFWKHRIEERQAEETFKVGLLYGPSGCGKSSLVNAGLLPRLPGDIVSICIETTARETEDRLRRALRRHFPGLPENVALPDALRQLRGNSAVRDGRKILIVLDQFEQWLQAWQSDADAELVRGLLQCDGGNIQCLLMVRDDYWLPITRFMRHLEVGIVESANAMPIDSFDRSHAKHVLREFGIAYQRLPERVENQTLEQATFLERAIGELAEENRLYPIRLAVFVEMLKDREWVPTTLDQMGGTEGVGVAFLEHSVGSLANTSRRIHAQAARNVLAALLPEAGQIKGSVRTYSELLEASGYTEQPEAFEESMHLLDVELRLLTPVKSLADDSSQAEGASSPALPQHSEMTYQLTHDFLVPSIREWLERQMRGSRKGRARLLLQEQSQLWNSRSSSRYLPTFMEWMGIWASTDRNQWTDAQRRMMQAAGRRIARQTMLALAAIIVISLLGTVIYQRVERQQKQRFAATLCSQLQGVEISDVPEVVLAMARFRAWTDPLLRTLVQDDSQSESRRIRAALALLPVDPGHADWLTDRLVSEQLPPDDFLVVRNALEQHGEPIAARLRREIEDDQLSPRKRFRVACALAGFDTSSDLWKKIGSEIANTLLREPAADARTWTYALLPVATILRNPLIDNIKNVKTLDSARIGVNALYQFDGERPDGLVELLIHAGGPQYRAVLETLRRDPAESLAVVHERLKEIPAGRTATSDGELPTGHKSNLILASFELGDPSFLRDESESESNPELRTHLVHGLAPERVDFSALLPLITQAHDDEPLQRLAMLAAWHHTDEPISDYWRGQLIEHLFLTYRTNPDRETHAAAGLLLRKLNQDLTVADRELVGKGQQPNYEWFLNRVGQTMMILGPEQSKQPNHSAIGYAFAISATEVTFKDFRDFWTNHVQEITLQVAGDDVPASGILPRQMAAYCNWLSKLDDIAESEWCYPNVAELKIEELKIEDCHPVPGFLEKQGYRLPLNSEWEFACRGGTTTARFFGEELQFSEFYAWDRTNSDRRLQRVGQLLPNPFGLFDVYGNAAETCINHADPQRFTSRGESCLVASSKMRSDAESTYDERVLKQFQGLRVVRRLK